MAFGVFVFETVFEAAAFAGALVFAERAASLGADFDAAAGLADLPGFCFGLGDAFLVKRLSVVLDDVFLGDDFTGLVEDDLPLVLSAGFAFGAGFVFAAVFALVAAAFFGLGAAFGGADLDADAFTETLGLEALAFLTAVFAGGVFGFAAAFFVDFGLDVFGADAFFATTFCGVVFFTVAFAFAVFLCVTALGFLVLVAIKFWRISEKE